MFAKTSVFVLIFASFQIASSYGNADFAKKICEAPAMTGKGAERMRMTDVSVPDLFLSGSVKDVPAVCMSNGLVYRYEVEEPSDDNEVMNAAKQSIGETSPEAVEAAKEKLVELLKNDTKLNVPLDNSAWLVRFLRLRKYNVPAAYELIKNYYNFKADNKKLLSGLTASSEKEIIENNVFGVLPQRAEDGSRIAVISIKNWDPKRFSLVDTLKTGVVLTELGSYEPGTQIAGVRVIIDSSGLTASHIKRTTPSMLKKIIEYAMYAAPFRSEGIHFVNNSGIFARLYKMIKPYFNEELRNQMHFHGSDMESLHRFISPSLLPEVYGGSYPAPTFTVTEWDTLLKTFDEEFAKLNTYGVKKN